MNMIGCHIHTFLRQASSVDKSERTVPWSILLYGIRYLQMTKQYKKWQISTTHSIECTRQKSGRNISDLVVRGWMRKKDPVMPNPNNDILFGTLVKTIPWKWKSVAAMVLRLRGVHRLVEKLTQVDDRRWNLQKMYETLVRVVRSNRIMLIKSDVRNTDTLRRYTACIFVSVDSLLYFNRESAP